jgi:hypothetical protein
MISSLFRSVRVKELTDNKNNNDQKADDIDMKPQMHTEAFLPVSDIQEAAGEAVSLPLDNLDQLSAAARELLMDKNLEVSKVRPFFWSMVETYVDRFHVFPFDVNRALFSYLESRDFPPDQMKQLVRKLEECYEQQHGEPMHNNSQLANENECLDEEIKALRDSLKYAGLVGELDEAE